MKSLLKWYTAFSYDGASKSWAWLWKWVDALEGQTVMIKKCVRAGANSFQLLLTETFLFRSNHTRNLFHFRMGKPIVQNMRIKKFFLFATVAQSPNWWAGVPALTNVTLEGGRVSRVGMKGLSTTTGEQCVCHSFFPAASFQWSSPNIFKHH